MTNTPNLNLDLPIVQSTLWPTYAQMNNEAFETIDAHDHSPGSGVLVPTVGLNINLDLPLNGFAITEANAITLQPVVAIPANLSVYSSAGELFYKDASGTAVQITVGGAVDAGIGNVTGLGAYVNSGARTSSVLFSTLGLDFSFYYDGTKLGAVNTGDIRLYPYSPFTNYTNFITLKSPTALSSGYALTLATSLPASTQLVQVSSTGQLSYTNAITQPLTLGSNLLLPGGSDGDPTLRFIADIDTGLFLVADGVFGITTAGNQRVAVSFSSLELSVPIYALGGSASSPAYTFATDTNTGMYLQAADSIGWSVGGTVQLVLNTTLLSSGVPILVPSGSDGSPAYTFNGDSNTGIFRAGADVLGFTTGGNQRMTIASSVITANVGLVGTTADFSSTLEAGSLNTGGGAFKILYYTGTISGSSSVTIGTGATILSVSSWCTNASVSSVFAPIMNGVTDVSYNLSLGTASTVVISNSSAGARTYRVVVITT